MLVTIIEIQLIYNLSNNLYFMRIWHNGDYIYSVPLSLDSVSDLQKKLNLEVIGHPSNNI